MKKAIIIIGVLALMLSFSAPKKQVFVVKTHPDLVEIYTKKYFAMGCNLTAAFPVEAGGSSINYRIDYYQSETVTVKSVMLIFEK